MILTLSVLVSPAFSCRIEPAHRLIAEPDRFVDEYDVVFFGKLVGLEDLREFEQLVEFSVEKTIKGDLPHTVMVINRMHTSCSRFFQIKGSKYYVFAAKTHDRNTLLIDGFASFVPESLATERKITFENFYNK